VADPNIDYRMQAVDDILKSLDLQNKPRLRVFNKADRCDPDLAHTLAERYHGVLISALDRATLNPLIEKLETFFINRAGEK
jgi:GTPase